MAEQPLRESDQVEEARLIAPGLIHELRHPLQGVKGGLELMALKLGPGATGLAEWEMVRKQLQRMEEVLQSYAQLLTPGQVTPQVFEVEEVVEQAVELLSFRLRRLGKHFSWKAPLERNLAFGAATALLHAVTNLLVNAVDAAEDAGPEARVHLRVLRAPDKVEVRISDEGRGIRPEVRLRLFQPRFTTKLDKGTGLGLHIARTMMRHSGGWVKLVEDDDPWRQPGARTEFLVEVPAHRT